MTSSKQHPAPLRKSSRVLGPTIKTFNYRVQKQVSLPAVERQSLRIAIAQSIKTDDQYKLATTPPTIADNAPAVSPPARRVLRSSNTASAPAMAPPRRGATLTASRRQHQGTATGAGAATAIAAASGNKKLPQTKTQGGNNDQPELDLSRGIPAGVEGYYCIKGILAEAPLARGAMQYLVEWDGTDPSTGMAWPFEWVGAADLTDSALDAWKTRDTKGKN
ncbi:hypothetical protein PG991_009490 [Apiospora marii]|uniref:Chromo domain-containing protein n=1 Tax=Apiospora marii TaxID=335849 RepID=A0ABR1RL08_9PEZI